MRRKGWHLLVVMILARANMARCGCTGIEREKRLYLAYCNYVMPLRIKDVSEEAVAKVASQLLVSEACALELKLEAVVLDFLAFGMQSSRSSQDQDLARSIVLISCSTRHLFHFIFSTPASGAYT